MVLYYPFQNIIIEESQENIMVDKTQVLKIWLYYITDFCGGTNRPKNLQLETKEEVGTDEKVFTCATI